MTKKQQDYFLNAAKQIPWPVTVEGEGGYVSVSECDLQEAREHSMVSFLCKNHAFHIQLAIGITKRDEFAPILRQRIERTPEQSEEFPIGIRYQVVSTESIVELAEVKTHEFSKRLSKPVYIFRYPNSPRMPFSCYKENIEKSLKLGQWIKIPV